MSDVSLIDRIKRELGAGKLKLPPFSATALELQRQLADPECTIERIADLISQDPALAGRTLRMANSPFYGGLTPVETISRAIVRLGSEKVLGLAMAAAGAMAMQSREPRLDGFLQRLWLRCFVSAQGCRWLAEASAEAEQAEVAFLAGLLHDLGELFLLKALERLMQDGEDAADINPALVEEVLDSLHARLGESLLRAWGLPGFYADIARAHAEADFDCADHLLAMVRLCDLGLRKAGIGQAAEPDLVLAATPEAQALGLNEIQLARFEVELDDAVALAREFGSSPQASAEPA